jgi:hypothetical protein
MKYVVEIIVSILLLSVTSYFFYVSIKNNTGGPSKPPDDKCETYINNLIRNQPQWHVALWFAIPTSLILFFLYYYVIKTNNCKFSYLSLIFVFTLLLSIIFVSKYFMLNYFTQHYIAWWFSVNGYSKS